jgi:hypothetical protein
MSNASEDVFEPSLRLTSEIRLIHWESQKGKDRELAIPALTNRALPITSVDSIALKIQPMVIRNEVTLIHLSGKVDT